jgi:hypothetical protein
MPPAALYDPQVTQSTVFRLPAGTFDARLRTRSKTACIWRIGVSIRILRPRSSVW